MYKVPLSYNPIDADGLHKIVKQYEGRHHEELILDFEALTSARLLESHTIAVASGTAALHLALMALGIKSGDHVAVPTFSYVASVNPVLYQQAVPVWIDSEETTWNLDPDLLEMALKKSTGKKRIKAIIVVHNYGVPADMDRIMRLARSYEVPVIEDAAEAWGATLQGKPSGTVGDIGVFSFNNNKTVTAFGGGLVVTKSKQLAARIRLLATQARLPRPYYLFKEVGFNYRISPLVAAYGILSVQQDDKLVHDRQQVFRNYCKSFDKIPAVSWAQPLRGHIASRWLSAFRYPIKKKRSAWIKELENQGIETRVGWNPLHRMKHLKHFSTYLNGTSESLFKEVFCLPSSRFSKSILFLPLIALFTI